MSSQQPQQPQPSTQQPPPSTQQLPGLSHSPSLQSTLSNLEDVDAWLSHPDNVAMLQNLAEKVYKNKATSMNGSDSSQHLVTGVENPSKTIADFHAACQKKGLHPQLDLHESSNQRFTGTLRFGTESVSLSVGMRSKKDAKAWLAQQGLPIVGRSEVVGKITGAEQNEINWIGKLLEYCNSLAVPPTVDYDIVSPREQSFTCTLSITPSPLNGTPWIITTPTICASKKAAKASVAEKAVATLIAAGKLASDGSLHKSHSRLGNIALQSVGADSSTSAKQTSESYGARVAALCTTLGMRPPAYKLAALDPVNAPTLISGACYFPGEPIKVNGVVSLEGGPIGEVRHIHGKKAAKEECAKQVLEYLENVKAARLTAMGMET